MELVYNNDTAFFDITSRDWNDGKNPLRLTNENLISFSVEEEAGKITNGSLVIFDPQNLYSKLFRYGMQFQIAWGYRKWNTSLITSANQLNAASSRQGLKAIVINPSGSGDQGGNVKYNVNFYSTEILAQKKVRVFDTGSKSDVITSLFYDLGIPIENQYIKMDTQEQNFRLNTENIVRQDDATFPFLNKLARKWHCTLRIGFDKSGNQVGIFIQDIQGNSSLVDAHFQAIGFPYSIKTLYYNNGDLSNVIRYNWQNHVGDSGQGVFIKMDYVNGTYIFQRYEAKDQTIINYKLNQSRISEYIKQHPEQETALISEIFNAESFNSQIGNKTVQWFFDRITDITAPQGLGYTVNCSMKGDPFLSPMIQIRFGDHFTGELKIDTKLKPQVPIYFTIRKAVHSINKEGYYTDIEVVDSYILNGGGFLQNTTPLQVVQ